MSWEKLLSWVSGKIDRELQSKIEYLAAENRILRAQIQERPRLTDAQRVTLARIGVKLGKAALEQVATIVTHDRDTKFSAGFQMIFRSAGIEPLALPPRSPNLSAFAERFVQSIKTECLDRMIFFGEASMHHAVTQYIEHYHHERPHQAKGNRLLFPQPSDSRPRDGPVLCKQRLGGLLKFYHRKAA
jgi:transposase InsO family protein